MRASSIHHWAPVLPLRKAWRVLNRTREAAQQRGTRWKLPFFSGTIRMPPMTQAWLREYEVERWKHEPDD